MGEKKRKDTKGRKRKRRSKDDVAGKARKEIVGIVIIIDTGGKKGRGEGEGDEGEGWDHKRRLWQAIGDEGSRIERRDEWLRV